MGLDMYLKANLYLSGYDFVSDEEKDHFRRVVEASGLEGAMDPTTLGVEVSVTVAYWRKANAVHGWFVRRVQDGQDDCGTYRVTRTQLQELRDLCAEVLEVAITSEGQPVQNGTTYYPGGKVVPQFTEGRAILNSEQVEKLLPTVSGFFFGSTGYDEWYIRDVENTVELLDKALNDVPHTCAFYYESSW